MSTRKGKARRKWFTCGAMCSLAVASFMRAWDESERERREAGKKYKEDRTKCFTVRNDTIVHGWSPVRLGDVFDDSWL